MTACIGWDGPCPMYGQFHGCMRNLDTPHADRQHVCDCGARTPTGRGRSQPTHTARNPQEDT